MIENLSTEKLTDEKYLNLYRSTYLKDGNTMYWSFASRGRGPKGEAIKKTNAIVVIGILPEEGRAVVTKEYRIPLQDHEYGNPAGIFEEGYTHEQMAAKELKEEAGCILDKVLWISPVLISSAGMSDECSQVVCCTCHRGDGQELEPQEIIDVMFPNANELEAMLDKPDIGWACKSWPILKFYVLPLLRENVST